MILERLAAAEDLGAFVVQQDELEWLHALALGPSLSSATAAPAGSPGQVLLAAWVAATARGMQLAAQQLDVRRWELQHSKAVVLLCLLVGGTSDCWLYSLEGLERVRVALSVLVVRTGVVKAHEPLSLRLTSIIGDPAAAQQQQQIAPELASLASLLLDLFISMGQAWPGGAFSPSLCQAVPAAAGLAVAVLRSREAHVVAGRPTNMAWTSALNVVGLLCNAYNEAGSGSSVPAQIAESSSVGTLLLMCLGLAAERVHQSQHGLSPAAVGATASAAGAADAPQQQQRLAVPAHDTQLLQALGVAAGGAHPNSPLAAKDVMDSKQLLGALLATPGQQRHLADAAAAASCPQTLLLVLLECALLEPSEQLVEDVVLTIQHTLARSGEALWQLGSMLLRTILEQDACRRALEAAAALAAAAAPVPAAAAAAVSHRAASHLGILLASLAMNISSFVLERALYIAIADQAAPARLLAGVTAVWLGHTAHYASLLEAGLRLMSGDGDAMLLVSCACRFLQIARLSAGSGGVAADSQQQVFALLLSCLKAATMAADKGSSSSSDGAAASKDAEQIWVSAGVVVQDIIDAGCALFSPSSSSASSSSNASSNQTSMASPAAAADTAAGLGTQLGCVLLARCLVAAGRLLQQLAQASAKDSSSKQYMLSDLLNACERAAALLVQQLPQAAAPPAAEPWLQRLLEEHAPLEQQLESLQSQLAAASAGEANPQLPAAALAGVAEQLQAFGAAVCAALPVQQCCNHHDCRNLEQASELELVGGKSCVCGGCQVARYCSRECQVAHYKGWHKAVCKRLQALRQQEAAQQQPAGS